MKKFNATLKKFIGLEGMILGTLVLAAELYMFQVLQSLDHISGKWRTNAWTYIQEPPCLVAVVITVAIIIFSFILFLFGREEEKEEKE